MVFQQHFTASNVNDPRGWLAPLSQNGYVLALRPSFPAHSNRGAALELPTSHRVPISWLTENACAAIQYRAVRDVMPKGWASADDMKLLREAALSYRVTTQLVGKQKATGLWGTKFLAPGQTIDQYRRLVELGLPTNASALQLSNRLLYRILSRDPDPTLYFEFKKDAKGNPEYAQWARDLMRQGATAALVHANQDRDPRVRGSAQRMANAISEFLRSEYVEDPFTRIGNRNALKPEVAVPTLYSVAVVAYMPSLQRERAGFADRLGDFITRPGPTKKFWIVHGKVAQAPTVELLGEPLQTDAKGRAKDIPFALYWLEILARMGFLRDSETAVTVFANLLGDCTEEGVWAPKGLRSAPSSSSGFADFAFPLEQDTKSTERRRSDVTFRLALIAKLAGLDLEFI